MKALILVADGFEELSLFLPYYRLKEEGVDVTLATPLMHGLIGQHGYKIEADAPLREVNADEYDLVVLPDGPAAEKLRVRHEAVDLVRTMVENGRWVAAVGHGQQVLLSAGALDGKTVTCSPGIRDDVRAAGALYRDESTILDGGLLTCRGADDLPEFCRRLTALLKSPTAARVG